MRVLQTSLLQAKKKVSGEISKEPFLDILLTDVEQSSFSLILTHPIPQKNGVISKTKHPYAKAKLVQKRSFCKGIQSFGRSDAELLRDQNFRDKDVLPKKVTLIRLKTSTYLFSKSLPATQIENFIGTQIPMSFEISYIFNPNHKSFLIKHFFVELALDLNIRGNRQARPKRTFVRSYAKDKNLNLISVYTPPERSSYLRYAKAYTPSHTGDKNSRTGRQHRTKFLGKVCSSTQKKIKVSCLLKIGDYVHCGDKIGYLSETPIVMSESGKVLRINQTQVTVQKIQPVLFYSQAEIHVESNEWVKRGTPILTLTHQTLVTGDIVQGIPRIEQLFEASTAAPPGAALQDFGSPSDDDSSKKSSIDDYLRSHHTSHLLPPTSSFMSARDKDVLGNNLETSIQKNNQISDNSKEERSAKLCYSTGHSTGTYVSNKVVTKNKVFCTGEGVRDQPMFLYKTLQSQVRETFRKKWDQYPLPVAVRQSLEEIQQIVVESIQKVYISQGVLIADKHIEIIVRQMTCKAQVFDGGSTGLLIDEILSLQQIENANISTPGQKALYLPVIMGLTRAALSSDSFVSAASFQETTRVLSRDAVAGKTDFLRGLKEKVIIGDLIDAGTGLDAFYIYSLFSKTIFENKFREILNRKVNHKTLKKLVLTATVS